MGNKHGKHKSREDQGRVAIPIVNQEEDINSFITLNYLADDEFSDADTDLGAYFSLLPPEILWHIWEMILSNVSCSFNEIVDTVYQISLINKQFHKIARYQMSEVVYRVVCPWFDPVLHQKLTELNQNEQV
jgi:hypothetical protein